MVKKIIACADIHIRNLRRMDEYEQQLSKFIDECKTIASEYDEDEVRIVVAGDLLHNKLDISAEGYTIASWFLRELDKIATTIVIAGNHDLNMANLNRIDPLSTIFSMCDFKRVHYLDSELGYASGCSIDDNIVWCLYSTFEKFAQPNIIDTKKDNEDKSFIGLFHGEIKSARTDVGFEMKNGLSTEYFEGLDFCICGHIHKRQELTCNGTPIVYCGSLIQQDHGENISGHGYIVLDVDSNTYVEKNIENEEYGFLTFSINSESDIDDNLEEVINL